MKLQIKEVQGAASRGDKDQFIQCLRGIAIAAVVLIHCLGKEGTAPIIIKSCLYFCTMLFVFLSGYLTPREKIADVWKFYKRRLIKTLIPYAIWTAIYLAMDGILTPWQFVKSLIRANACGPLYYLHDYAQLVVLTPVIYWLLDRRATRFALYLVTPCYIVFNYWLYNNGKYLLIPVCLWMMTAYIVGIEHEKWMKAAKKIKQPIAVVLVIFGAVAQMVESFFWRSKGIMALTNTQVKFTSLFFFLSVLILIAGLTEKQRNTLLGVRLLKRLGDLSSGIYCCHEVFLICLIAVIPKGWPNALLLWFLVLTGSVILMSVCRKFLPRQVNSWFMFG